DKQLGFPAFVTMAAEKPDFFVGTGDIVYYDNPFRTAETITELRKCWHEQFRFPRMIDFFKDVPTYWSKDDHDFRYNDSDNTKDRLPLSTTGIDMFREQLPLPEKSYRTIRVSQDLQIWLTEGRDYRSPNKMPDGPEKTLWGAEQKAWLQSTLKASDAKWKLLISPTPLVGPDATKPTPFLNGSQKTKSKTS
ncbi:alkaline phosphatase D family protein, partial [Akkermansiaceae bacterium]|nr:alkaline phosphatase D family protein [Akkermansiaceae bacterium]